MTDSLGELKTKNILLAAKLCVQGGELEAARKVVEVARLCLEHEPATPKRLREAVAFYDEAVGNDRPNGE